LNLCTEQTSAESKAIIIRANQGIEESKTAEKWSPGNPKLWSIKKNSVTECKVIED